MSRSAFSLCAVLATMLVLCAAFAPVLSAPQADLSHPQKVSVCQLQKDPPSFDHKLVEVEAFVSQGFEDFTLFDPQCFIYPEIWLEYGGKVNSGTIYFGPGTSDRKRPEDLVVQGTPIPLVDDEIFRMFDKRIHTQGPRGHGPITRATLVGTFFAGRKETYPSGDSAWSGFGHFGCCTLLAIEQVKAVDLRERPGLDPFVQPMPFIDGFLPNNDLWHSLIPADTSRFILESQRQTDEGSRAWAFDDPKRVALDLIEQDLRNLSFDPAMLKETDKHEGLFEFEAKMPAIGTKYTVTVARPAWLAFYARNPDRVAWVAIGAMAERLDKRKPMTGPGQAQSARKKQPVLVGPRPIPHSSRLPYIQCVKS